MAVGRGRYVCSTGWAAVLCGVRGGAFGVPKRKTAGLTALKRACPQCGGQKLPVGAVQEGRPIGAGNFWGPKNRAWGTRI